jgi:DNA-binding NtrC family response regulator
MNLLRELALAVPPRSRALCLTESERAYLAARGLTSTNDAKKAIVVALKKSVTDVEPTLTDARVAAILTANHGNVKRTAEEIGIARSTVRARVKRASGT